MDKRRRRGSKIAGGIEVRGTLQADYPDILTPRAWQIIPTPLRTNPDGADPFDRMGAAGITYRRAGENIALAGTVPRAHELLMNSEGHRKNILGADFGRVGIGIIDSSQGLVITQLFAD